jgi:hypothetical protein
MMKEINKYRRETRKGTNAKWKGNRQLTKRLVNKKNEEPNKRKKQRSERPKFKDRPTRRELSSNELQMNEWLKYSGRQKSDERRCDKRMNLDSRSG